ncbi:MAG: hypothetical protein ACI9C9_002907, partial [Marivirga sp.]
MGCIDWAYSFYFLIDKIEVGSEKNDYIHPSFLACTSA